MIAGGESGHAPSARLRTTGSLSSATSAAAQEVAFFFKQWGGRYSEGRRPRARGREWSEMPTPQARRLLQAV